MRPRDSDTAFDIAFVIKTYAAVIVVLASLWLIAAPSQREKCALKDNYTVFPDPRSHYSGTAGERLQRSA